MVVCLKLSVALGLNYPTTRPSLSGIALKDLDPTAASHCVSLNALFFACYANTGSHSDSNNHRSPQSHFRRHNDRTQYRLGIHLRWKTLMPGSPAINVLGTGLSLEPSLSTLGVNVPLVVQQPLPQPSLEDLVMEGILPPLLPQALPPPVAPKPFLGKTILHYSYHDYGGNWELDLMSSQYSFALHGFSAFR